MKEKLKILIDMDIGDDIDDAFALLLAMDMGIEIVGITTVFKNTAERARLTKKLLKLFGNGYENVPVYAGYGKPLRDDADEKGHLCQYTADLEDDCYTPDSICPERAVDFIIECCERYKDELTVIAIGPFTNIAEVIKKAPHALGLASNVIIMGGAYFRQYADWNVSCDPDAEKIMF
jgi:purine nucleosidase/pyrimidine-specific ribonucleoside hydrolase